MAHGYLGDGYGTHGEIDPDRGERDWRERGARGRDRDWRDRDRGMMFGGSDRDEWRGGRRSWSDEYRPNRGRMEERGFDRGDYPQDRGSYSANPDDHYRSWRDRHMRELDRDYQDYCREREQQFHREFAAWRRQKYGNPQPLRTGMTQSGISHDPTGMTQAFEDRAPATPAESDPTATATLGTNSGRNRR
jgi:hypothetical protein